MSNLRNKILYLLRNKNNYLNIESNYISKKFNQILFFLFSFYQI